MRLDYFLLSRKNFEIKVSNNIENIEVIGGREIVAKLGKGTVWKSVRRYECSIIKNERLNNKLQWQLEW